MQLVRKLQLVTVLVVVMIASAVVAGELQSVLIHPGVVDEKTLAEWINNPSKPTLVSKPSFGGDITAYAVRMPYGVDGVTLVVGGGFMAEEFGLIDLNGTKFEKLVGKELVSGGTYENYGRTFKVMSLRLRKGDNLLQLGAKSPFGLTIYKFEITRPAEPSSDTTLTALELSVVALNPAFDDKVRTYHARVIGNSLRVKSTPRSGSVTVSGRASIGTALRVDGDSITGLTPGKNLITIEVTAEDGSTATYKINAEVSKSIHTITKGDVIIKADDDCDLKTGCEATVNGVKGFLACTGRDLDYKSQNIRFSAKNFCSMSTGADGVISSAAGYVFAAFPDK